jgi:hypothetical protein
MRVLFLLASFAVLQATEIPASAQSSTPTQSLPTCPWLATGSAATVLGGDVTLTAHAENNWQGACRFERQGAGGKRSIDIRVSKVNAHPCPADSAKIPALGNEAAQCRRVMEDGDHAATIAGRVRDAFFEVNISGVPDATRQLPASADPNRSSLLERVAEQVAGSLF